MAVVSRETKQELRERYNPFALRSAALLRWAGAQPERKTTVEIPATIRPV
jgi:hypothetical protein